MDSVIAYMSESKSKNDDTSSDEYDVFGKYIANELRNITDTRAQRWIKWSIQNTLYTAHCGMSLPSRYPYPQSHSPASSIVYLHPSGL